jgi:hypothetical protein
LSSAVGISGGEHPYGFGFLGGGVRVGLGFGGCSICGFHWSLDLEE